MPNRSCVIGQCRSSSLQSLAVRYGKYSSSPSGKLFEEPMELSSEPDAFDLCAEREWKRKRTRRQENGRAMVFPHN
uniref:Uncharacterized protein n=1 Tax=Anopheles minimus TaxID=112268 RepID=A0A182VYI3_9DIPT